MAKRYDSWHMKGGGVGIDDWKVGASSKPTRILPKNAKLKALGKPLSANNYAKVPPMVEEDPLPVAMQPLRRKR